MTLTRIPGSQVPVLETNGLMSREWYRFFYNLFQLTGGGSSDITPAELQAEINTLNVEVDQAVSEVNALTEQVTNLDEALTDAITDFNSLQVNVELVLASPAPQVVDLGKAVQEAQLSLLATQVGMLQSALQDVQLSALSASMDDLTTRLDSLAMAPVAIPDAVLGVGSFYDTTTFVPSATGTAYAITFNTVSYQYKVYRGSTTSRIYVTNAGVYNFQFSAQLDNTSGGDHAIYFWPRINGTIDVPDSASQVRLKGNDAEMVAAWNFFLEMAAGDYFELMYSVDNTGVRIQAIAAASPVPGIPSVILTVNQVYSPYGH